MFPDRETSAAAAWWRAGKGVPPAALEGPGWVWSENMARAEIFQWSPAVAESWRWSGVYDATRRLAGVA